MLKWTQNLKWNALALAVLGTTMLSGVANAQVSAMDIDLKDADLVSAVQALTNRTGIQFVIADDITKFKPINLSLRNSAPEEAISLIVTSAGGWAERNEAGVYIIRSGKPEARSSANGTVTTPVVPMEVRKIRLKVADPKVVFEQVTGRFVFDPFEGFKEAQAVNQSIRESQQYGGARTTAVGEGVQTFTPTNLGLPVPATSEVKSDDILIPGDTARQLQPGGGGGGFPGGGGGGFPGGGGGGFPGGGGAGGAGGGLTLTPGTGLVPQGIDYLSYDPTDNSLVVRGSDEAIRQLQQVIALFDVAPKQVEIKVEFITTSQSVARSFGIDWTFSRGAVFAGAAPGAFARTGDPIFINYSTGNFVTRLRTRLIEGEGKVVSAPLVRTFNNQTGLITQTTTTTIFLPQSVVTSGVIQTNIVPQSLTVNTALIVRPRINNDGTITMSLAPQVQDFGQLRRGPDGTEIPDQLSSAIQIATRVADGETVLLAGFNRKSNQTTINKFPILGDLPIIGSLFRSTNTDRNSSELLIFVTPRVIQDADDSNLTP